MVDFTKNLSYCEKHSSLPNKVLLELERETHLKTLSPQMITGHLQGRLLSFISKWKQPNFILEIGTFTGYGTLCLAEGLDRAGVIHTIEVNPELRYLSQKYFKKSGIGKQVMQHLGDAKYIIPLIKERFDLIYIDAGKQEYPLHYDLSIEKMNGGGVLLVDNVLWGGKVGKGLNDRDTKAIESFNKKVYEDDRVRNLLLPIRDGLMIVEKK